MHLHLVVFHKHSSQISLCNNVNILGAADPISFDNLRTEFTVEKGTEEAYKSMEVAKWPTWKTEDSPKYKVGIKSPLKVYDVNELSYIISGMCTLRLRPHLQFSHFVVLFIYRQQRMSCAGKMTLEDAKTGKITEVNAGDFVTFPNRYEVYWNVIEPINKHYYLWDDDGNDVTHDD